MVEKDRSELDGGIDSSNYLSPNLPIVCVMISRSGQRVEGYGRACALSVLRGSFSWAQENVKSPCLYR